MPVMYGFSVYMDNPYMGSYEISGKVLYGIIYGTVFFFSNNALLKIDMNIQNNVFIPIFKTSFVKLQSDST